MATKRGRFHHMVHFLVSFLFLKIWKNWFEDDVKIVKVHSWNSCTFDAKGGTRYRSTMCGFPWE